MTYAKCYIIRFAGTLTQGPNAGKQYSFQSSWGGKQYETIEQASAHLAEYRSLEPSITLQLLSRQCVVTGKKSCEFVETIILD